MGQGRDYTLFALFDGKVRFERMDRPEARVRRRRGVTGVISHKEIEEGRFFYNRHFFLFDMDVYYR